MPSIYLHSNFLMRPELRINIRGRIFTIGSQPRSFSFEYRITLTYLAYMGLARNEGAMHLRSSCSALAFHVPAYRSKMVEIMGVLLCDVRRLIFGACELGIRRSWNDFLRLPCSHPHLATPSGLVRESCQHQQFGRSGRKQPKSCGRISRV